MTQPKPNISTAARQYLAPGKRLMFWMIVLLMPWLALALIESALRLAGFGGYAPIIRKVGSVDQETLAITDPAGAANYFFANRDGPGSNEQYSFLVPKPTNTVRIFLVGESAIKGFPQPRNLACSAFLQRMLQDAWPDRIVEVINLGTTAVASFPVLEMMKEALEYEPDLVVIYTGHNEFFGTYGVASIGRAGSRPWMLKANRFIRSLAVVQALEKLLPSTKYTSGQTLMETMIGNSYVGPNDWRRQAAARNLESNVGEMIDRCKVRGVPVLVCTQSTNERDLAPVGMDKTDALDELSRKQFEQLLNEGMIAAAENPTQAVAILEQALKLWPQNARAHFYLGRALLAQGESPAAKTHLVQARDLDSLPWRCTSISQEAILRAASRYGATVCDVEKSFRHLSTNGIIGWELMDDHVHPTLRGQALIAETIVASLRNVSGKINVSEEAQHRVANWEDYARRCGDNVYDQYGVAHQMRVIFDIGFMRQSNPDAYPRFDNIASGIENSADPEIQTVLREWQTARPHAGGKRPLTGMVGRVLMRQKKFGDALAMFEIARTAVPEYTSWYLEYVYFTLACREKLNGALTGADQQQALDAIQQGNFLLKRGYSESGFTERYVGRLHQLRGEFAGAIPYLLASRKKLTGFDLVAADEALIVSYLKTGDAAKARQVAEYGAEHAGQYAGHYRNVLVALDEYARTNQAGVR